MSEVAIVAPTAQEAAGLGAVGLEAVVGGVGPVEMAATVARLLREGARSLILAGIAGAYAGSGLEVGQSVLVETECTADVGTFRNGIFNPLFVREYRCPYVAGVGFRRVASNSVSAAGAPFVRERASAAGASFAEEGASVGASFAGGGAQIENMEGAAFFALCLDAGVRFVELRAISNIVAEPRENWRVEEAIAILGQELKKLLNAIEA
ncbi:MAG: hypothetical protein LBH06_08005 [Rikenellaceae bacterium]|jgi:adenosylhomocysteine nucleosidase/futalosine hydrolase|nr:hypothetical protein [Rikenellaceae bacterium]